jgi:hypothetical protein
MHWYIGHICLKLVILVLGVKDTVTSLFINLVRRETERDIEKISRTRAWVYSSCDKGNGDTYVTANGDKVFQILAVEPIMGVVKFNS